MLSHGLHLDIGTLLDEGHGYAYFNQINIEWCVNKVVYKAGSNIFLTILKVFTKQV